MSSETQTYIKKLIAQRHEAIVKIHECLVSLNKVNPLARPKHPIDKPTEKLLFKAIRNVEDLDANFRREIDELSDMNEQE